MPHIHSHSFIISDWVPIVKNWCGGDYSMRRVHVCTSHARRVCAVMSMQCPAVVCCKNVQT